MIEYSIAEGTSRTQKRYRNKKLTWPQMLKRLESPQRTSETAAEYKAMSKAERGNIKDVGGFVAGFLKGGSRKAVQSRSMLCLDVDKPDPDFWGVLTLAFDETTIALYSTHSSGPSARRYRIIIPLLRDVTPDEYQAVGRKVAEAVGIEQFDPTTFEPGRMMYWPSCSRDGEYIFKSTGENTVPLDPDEILNRYTDWRDVSSWAAPESAEELRRKTEKRLMQDIEQKRGVIGAFVRAYTIHEAIAAFVPDYKRSDNDPTRYTYAPGSTANGVVTYEDKFSYSHHATDPASGREVNAFDLVRLHKFGELDAGAAPDTPPPKLPSYRAMLDFATHDRKTKKRLSDELSQDFSDETGADKTEGAAAPDDWEADLDIGEGGRRLSNAKNVELVLLYDKHLAGLFGFNEFTKMESAKRDLPWRKVSKMTSALTDGDDAQIRVYMSKRWGIKSNDVIHDVLTTICRRRENVFHPVREYLSGLTWDKIPRLDRLLVDYFDCEDTPYTRAVTRKTLLGAVKRVFEPGYKFDTMLVLKGPQGCGKSTFFRLLAKDWFSDSLKDIKSKDAMDGLRGVWIVEISELAAMRKADSEDIKSFISRQKDFYRPAYGRRAEEFPRQNIFVATTNEPGFLRDRTGNRRFWPVGIPKSGRPCRDVFTQLEGEVDQIWAEAVSLYKSGTEDVYLSRELTAAAIQMQELFMQEDPRVPLIVDYLNRLLPEGWEKMSSHERISWLSDAENVGTIRRTRTCAAEIWIEALKHDDTKDLNRLDAVELNRILDSLPDWERSSKTLRFAGLGVQKGFIRIL